ncbi:glycosyl hydrolase [Pedobacter psychrodurus]|uniref:Glycosyl hydrolase n=1 Tax=Pedobacter psychrodurus TaxID=2530456 RepID=A0A4R0Q5I5_9SPHI|nr:glycoside hydrolase family 3 C-terminal domain-containing protein [Pedobacter psychrodurus]TCD28339.1 glycosyl hydrolase [Pedobacter psychrodurus]
MSFKNILAIAFVISIFTFLSFSIQKKHQYPFQNSTLPTEVRVDNLVGLLTLEEKISQMVNNSPAIKRLNIPAYNWWNETLHGVARSSYNVTSYPQAIAMAATWDTTSLKTMANYSAIEGRAIYNDSKRQGKTGIYLGLTYWTPNINIFRDPRWGRGQETYGEDPYLTGTLGKAFVRGLEGDHPKYLKASACAKHFAVHSGPEWNRSTFNAKVSDFDLWDTYLPAFRDLIVDAKVSGVMCAYNAFDGQPCCGSDKLMQKILRDDWKFTGYVTSDCGGISHFWRTHKTHPSKEAAAADAVLHGTDCECSGDPTYRALLKAVNDGLITEKEITTSVKRLFTIRFRLGMFDEDKEVPFSKIDTSVLESAAHKTHALKMARQSMVLLKNEPFKQKFANVLPFGKGVKKIALVGPNADDKTVMLANYYGFPSYISSVLDGIRSKKGIEVIYEKGCNLIDNKVFKPNWKGNKFSFEGKPGFQVSYFKNNKWEGKPAVVSRVPKIDFQWGDGEQVAEGIIANQFSMRFIADYKADQSGDVVFELKGDDNVKLFVNGEKQIDTDLKGGYYTLKAQKGKIYKLVIDYLQYSDNAEIEFNMGTIETASPATIASRVKDADVIVFVGGIAASLEGEAMPVSVEGFKGGDRTNIELPKIQTNMMKALKATGKPVVFVNMSGGAMGFEWEAANLPVILQAWYGGQAGGQAIADVLFGDYNPAGRLPVTFYKNVSDLPDFEDYSMDNRTYRYFKGEPLFAFGHGLSYTTFKYSNLKISKSPKSNEILVSVNITNTGKIAGDEVAQLYLAHKNNSYKTPIRTLKGYQRNYFKAGETKQLQFKLGYNELSEVNSLGKLELMKGSLDIAVGGAQPNAKLISEGKSIQKQFVFN